MKINMNSQMVDIWVDPKEILKDLIKDIKNSGKDKFDVDKILTMINDIRIKDVTSMVNEVAKLKPGSSAKISLQRNGQTIQLPIVIGERPTVSTTRN